MRLASGLLRIQKGEGRLVALVMSLMFMTTAGMMVGESGIEALVVVPFVDRGGPSHGIGAMHSICGGGAGRSWRSPSSGP
jgi:hypothetical protein